MTSAAPRKPREPGDAVTVQELTLRAHPTRRPRHQHGIQGFSARPWDSVLGRAHYASPAGEQMREAVNQWDPPPAGPSTASSTSIRPCGDPANSGLPLTRPSIPATISTPATPVYERYGAAIDLVVVSLIPG